MNVKVLGTGCSTCKQLFKNVEDLINELDLEIKLEKIEDLSQIMSYGVMSLPALVINDQVKFSGKCPSKEELKKYFIF